MAHLVRFFSTSVSCLLSNKTTVTETAASAAQVVEEGEQGREGEGGAGERGGGGRGGGGEREGGGEEGREMCQ